MNFNPIAKYFDPSADDEEKKKMQAWLEEDPSRQIEFDKLMQIWEEARRVSTFSNIDTDTDWMSVKSRISGSFRLRHKKISVFFYTARIAAIVLLTFGLTFGLIRLMQTAGSRNAAFVKQESLDQVRSIILPDGSSVSLNINSSVSYKKDFDHNSREVILEGEAFFEVNPDPTHPFRVYTGNSIVEVTGTDFSIFEDTAFIRVGVLSGSVYLKSSENPSIGTVVAQNESGLIYKDNTLEKQSQVSTNIISWKTGQLIFYQTPVETALLDIAHHFHKDLLIETAMYDSLTAKFTNQPLDEILDELCIVTSLSITQTNNIIIVKQ